jgi:hypothetical protein
MGAELDASLERLRHRRPTQLDVVAHVGLGEFWVVHEVRDQAGDGASGLGPVHQDDLIALEGEIRRG